MSESGKGSAWLTEGWNPLFEKITVGVCIYRHDPADDSFELLRANAAADKAAGLAFGDYVGKKMDTIFPAARNQSLYAACVRAAKQGVTLPARSEPKSELALRAVDVSAVGLTNHHIALVYDRSRSQETAEALFHNIPLGVVTYRYLPDRDDFQLLRANPAAATVVGFDLDAKRGAFMTELFPGMRDNEAFRRYAKVAEEKEAAFSIRQGRYEGEDRAIVTDVHAFRSGPLEVSLAFDDVSDLVQAEQTLERERTEQKRRIEEQLAQSNTKLEELARLASHDLHAPVRGMLLAADWLEEELLDKVSDDSKETLGFLTSRAKRMSRLVEGVQGYVRTRNATDTRSFDMGDLVKKAVARFPSDRVVLDDAEAWPRGHGDPTQVQEVIENLVSNGLLHGRPPVTVRVAPEGSDGLRVQVHDVGPGIRPEHRENIFHPFRTAEGRGLTNTNGVGLAIGRLLVTSWGGRLEVEDSPQGALFAFTLPRAPS